MKPNEILAALSGAMVGGRMVHLAPATPLDAPSVMAVAYERLLVAADKRYRVLPWQMGVVAKLLRALPNSVFDLLFARAPTKPRKEAA